MNSLRIILSKRQYFTPALIFATLNIAMGTWAIYIPEVKSRLGISEGDFGLALFCFGLGVLCMVVFSPSLIQRLQVGKATFIAVLCLLITILFPISSTSYMMLCASLFTAGLSTGFLDISMNALVSQIERDNGVRIMAANHGFFSLGGMIGAGVGLLIMPVMPSPMVHMGVICAVLIVIHLWLASSYKEVKGVSEKGEKFGLKEVKPLFALIVVAFFVMGSEGAIEHWSALYLEKVIEAPATLLGLGFTIFSFTMALFRFLGDGLSSRFGSYRLIQIGLVVAIVGLGLIVSKGITNAFIGFGLIGVGYSVIIPELFRIAGNTPQVNPEKGIAIVSGVGFLGFLMFPFILGTIAEYFDLSASFLTLLFGSLLAFTITLFLKKSF